MLWGPILTYIIRVIVPHQNSVLSPQVNCTWAGSHQGIVSVLSTPMQDFNSICPGHSQVQLFLESSLTWFTWAKEPCFSVTKSCPTPCDPMDCSPPGFPVLHYLLELAQTHVHWVGDAIQPSHPLLPPSPLALNLSQHQALFQWVNCSHRWPNYWNFSITSSNEYSGLISFRTDCFDLLTVQGNLKSLLQHHNLKAKRLDLCTETPG